MKIDEIKLGEKYELEARNATTNEPEKVRFEVIEVGWFSSKIKPGILFKGARVRTEDGEEHEINLLTVEFSHKVQ